MKDNNFKLTYVSCYTGYVIQAITVNLAPIFFVIFQTDYSISYSSLANLILVTFGIQLVIDSLSIKLYDLLGMRAIAILSNIMATLGLIGLGTLPRLIDPFTGIAISLVVCGIGSGFIEVIISPIIDAIPKKSSTSGMSLLHSFYCWGQVLTVFVSTVILMIVGKGNWHFIPFIWAVIPFVNIFMFIKSPMPKMVGKNERTPVKNLIKSKEFIILMWLMVCSGATEVAVSQWASLFAEKGLGVTKTMGDLLGPCLFAVFMGIGRTLYGTIGNRYSIKKAIVICASGAVICYFAMVFVPVPIIGLLACAMTGFCVSLMWPGTLSLGSKKFPLGGMAVFSLAAVFGDLGCTAGPWIAGQVSEAAQKASFIASLSEKIGLTTDQIGLRVGILACVIFPVSMIIAATLINEPKKEITN